MWLRFVFHVANVYKICEILHRQDKEKIFSLGRTYYESTTLQFTTTDEIRQSQELAFVVTDVNNHTYVIGCKEAPYPVVDITTNLDNETNISEVKVTFQRQKSLIPCVV